MQGIVGHLMGLQILCSKPDGKDKKSGKSFREIRLGSQSGKLIREIQTARNQSGKPIQETNPGNQSGKSTSPNARPRGDGLSCLLAFCCCIV